LAILKLKKIELLMTSMRIVLKTFIKMALKIFNLFVEKYNLDVINNESSSQVINAKDPRFNYYSFLYIIKKNKTC